MHKNNLNWFFENKNKLSALSQTKSIYSLCFLTAIPLSPKSVLSDTQNSWLVFSPRKMDTSTSNFDAHITHNMQIIDVGTASLSESFQSLKSKSQQTSQNQGFYSLLLFHSLTLFRVFTLSFCLSVQLHDVKCKLKEVEDELVEVLAGYFNFTVFVLGFSF